MNCINLKPIEVTDKATFDSGKLYMVPCGKCLACLSNSRNDWIFRLNEEWKVSKSALFVTLTYSSKYCPDYVEKKHVQLYLKRLRKREPEPIRYFAVGEYGTKRKRPHYHLLLFNVTNVDNIRDAWMSKSNEPFGIVHVGRVSQASIAYCTKYIVQPVQRQKKDKEKFPFRLMSRGYGIGAHYLSDEMVDYHRQGLKNYAIQYGTKCRLPRFYKNKIWYAAKSKDGLREFVHPDKEKVSENAKMLALESEKKEMDYYNQKFGENADLVRKEFRNAYLSRIQTKVAFTEKL